MRSGISVTPARLAVAACAILAAAGLVPAAAKATVASVGGPTLYVTAHPGEANRITIMPSGGGQGTTNPPKFVIYDAGGKLVAGAGCTRIPHGPLQCAPAPGTVWASLKLVLGDGNDAASVKGRFVNEDVDAGTGTDRVHIDRSDAPPTPDTARPSTTVRLGSGPDVLVLDAAHNYAHLTHTGFGCCLRDRTQVDGGDGADVMLVFGDPQLVTGGAGADTIRMPDSRAAYVYGGSGDDAINADGFLFGDDGNDVLRHAISDVDLRAIDELNFVIPEPPVNAYWRGGAGDDEIYRSGEDVDCGPGIDTLHGNGGLALNCEVFSPI